MNLPSLLSKIAEESKTLYAEYGCEPFNVYEKNASATVLSFFNQKYMRVSENKKGIKLEIKKSFIADIKFDESLFGFTASSPDWGSIYLDSALESAILNNIKIMFFHCYTLLPENTYGCCSQFTECSNSKKCINPNKLLAYGCLYRRNLEQGRIFYGQNRNV